MWPARMRAAALGAAALALAAGSRGSAAPLLSETLFADPDGPGLTYAEVMTATTFYASEDEVRVVVWAMNPVGAASATLADPSASSQNGFYVQRYTRTPSGAVSLSPGTGQAFTWTFVPDRSNASGPGSCQQADFADGFLVTDGPDAIVADLDEAWQPATLWVDTPANVSLGDVFTATLWLVSVATDRPVVIGAPASATPYLAPAFPGSFIKPMGGPVPATAVVPAGGSTAVAFTFTAAGLGTQGWTGGVAYGGLPSLYGGAACLGVNGPPSTNVLVPSPLTVSLSTSATRFSTGDPYLLLMTVFNASPTCAATLYAFSALDVLSANGGAQLGTLPANLASNPVLISSTLSTGGVTGGSTPFSVPPGATLFVDWLDTARDCGSGIRWGTSLSGAAWAPCSAQTFVMPVLSNPLDVYSGAAVVVSATLLASSVLESQTAYVTFAVTPASFDGATQFAVAVGVTGDPGASVWVTSAPVVPTVLGGCGSCVASPCTANTQVFTWSYYANAKGSSLGRVAFTFTVSGVDALTGRPLSPLTSTLSVTTPFLRIKHPSVLTVAPEILDLGTPGCPFGAGMDILADGDTDVVVQWMTAIPGGTGTAAQWPGLGDGGQAVVLPFDVPSDTHVEWTWTYSPTGAGTVSFTFSIAGIEAGLGTTLMVSSGTGTWYETVTPAAPSLTAAANGQRTSSVVTIAPNSSLTVTFSLSNSGSIAAGSIAASATPWPGGSCGSPGAAAFSYATLPDSSVPVGGCGDHLDFAWTFTPTATGWLAFTVSVTARDVQTGSPFTVQATTPCVQVVNRTPVHLALLPGSLTEARGSAFPVTLTVTNAGDTNIWVRLFGTCVGATDPATALVAAPGVTVYVGAGGTTLTATLLIGAASTADSLLVSLTNSGSLQVMDLTTRRSVLTVLDPSPGVTVYVTRQPLTASVPAAGPLEIARGGTTHVTVTLANPGGTTVLVSSSGAPVAFARGGFTADRLADVAVTPNGNRPPLSWSVTVYAAADAPFGDTAVGVGGGYSATDLATPGPGATLVVVSGGGVAVLRVVPPAGQVVIGQNPYHVLQGGLTVTVRLPEAGHARMVLYSILGEKLTTLLDEDCPAGEKTVVWDGRNAKGAVTATGVYLLRYEGPGLTETLKLAVVK